LDQGTNEEFENYVNDPERFRILDNNGIYEEIDEEKTENTRDVTINEFIDKYIDIFQIPIDDQRRQN
jgi:hypothetical protein